MNIIFFGSSKFAVPALRSIIDSSHNLVCVVTQPDRQKGRGLDLSCTEVKESALDKNIKTYQPENVNDQDSVEFLRALNPDFFVVVSFGQILSEAILKIPAITAINLHASLLPKYRGAAPIRRAIINGEIQTGLTIIKMIKKLDAGDLILQEKVNIEESDDALSLEKKLSKLGGDLLLKALDLIQSNKCTFLPQSDKDATFAPKLEKQEGLVRWSREYRDVFNLIRGCAGWPGAFTYYKGKIIKIHKASCVSFLDTPDKPSSGPAGEILHISKKGIVVASGGGNLLIEELQAEGKKALDAARFISGYRVSVGDTFSDKK